MNKLVDRLYKIYPFQDKNISKYYYRNHRVRQFAHYLHNLSWDMEKIDDGVKAIRVFEKIGVSNFIYLCDMLDSRRMDDIIDMISFVIREKV